MSQILTPDSLKRRRKALGLTQVQLAELLDVKAMTVARWEWGARSEWAIPIPMPRALDAFLEKLETEKTRAADTDSS